MFQKVSIKEIKNIKERLKAELEDKNLAFQRKVEIKSLIYRINNWLDWKDYQERKHYKEVIQSKS